MDLHTNAKPTRKVYSSNLVSHHLGAQDVKTLNMKQISIC